MANLLDLPNEILHGITSVVSPEDLENFAQTCPEILSVARPFLNEHRERIRKYAICSTDNRADQNYHPYTKLAKDIAENKRLGSYIIRLACNGSHVLRHFDSGSAYTILDFSKLLDSLPNLRALSMDESHDDLIRWRAHLKAPNTSKMALSKLREFYLRSSGYQGVPLGLVQVFSALPNLRTLFISNSGDVGDEGLIVPVQSNVTHLELDHCQIRAEELHEFLRGFSQLAIFIYSGDRGGTDRDDHSIAFAIPSGLLCSKKRLRKLKWVAPGKPKCFMGSLEDFETLKELETEYTFLRPHNDEADLQLQLPISLERLSIMHQKRYLRSRCNSLLSRILPWKSQYYSQLRSIDLQECSRGGWATTNHEKDDLEFRTLKQDCEDVGVTLKIYAT